MLKTVNYDLKWKKTLLLLFERKLNLTITDPIHSFLAVIFLLLPPALEITLKYKGARVFQGLLKQ